MKFDKVIIKQIPDDYAIATGLNKYNRSKMPGTSEFLQVAINLDGRYVTGIDEDAYAIKSIKDPVEREEKIKEIKELREYLEQATQQDLSGTSAFWETFGIHISADSDLTLHRANPRDVIKYHALIANRYAAPDFASTSKPAYLNCKFYCHIEEKVNQEIVSTQKLRDKARSELYALSENEDRAVLIGQYLEGDKYKTGMSPSTVYRMLSDFIDNSAEPENLKKFTKANALSTEDLTYKIVIDRAIKRKHIKYKDGYYQRGQVTLGKNPLEVYENLKKPDFASEFLSIKDEVEEV